MQFRIQGVIAAAATPLDSDLKPDSKTLVQHTLGLLKNGCHFVSPFGTTGEANSLAAPDRIKAMRKLCENGVSPKSLLPGTGACALSDARKITDAATELEVAGILLLPPFYFVEPPLAGLLNYFRPLLEIAEKRDTPVILYNIPQFTNVRISLELFDVLRADFGPIVLGIKDSSGDWEQTSTYLSRSPDIAVFPGSEALLDKAIPLGAAGCISGSANVTARESRAAYDAVQKRHATDGVEMQTAKRTRSVIQEYGLMPAVKHLLQGISGDPAWGRFLPPLCPLDMRKGAQLTKAFTALVENRQPA